MAARVLVAGASGHIGSHVVAELLRQGYQVVALLRPDSDWHLEHPDLELVRAEFAGSGSWFADLKACSLVVSCLASRTGGPDDARRVEYDANMEVLAAAQHWGATRFLLLSAICVQKPRLAFQREKLRFEAALQQSGVPWTIVRATAFFKSLSGQIERVRDGKPFFVFGKGTQTACKPIAEQDLAAYITERLADPDSAGSMLPVGGPGPAITPRQQAEMLGHLLGRPVRVRSLPAGLFLALAALLTPFGTVSRRLRDRAEFLRIAHFYATESMLLWSEETASYRADLTPETGSRSLADCYRAILAGHHSVQLGEHKLF